MSLTAEFEFVESFNPRGFMGSSPSLSEFRLYESIPSLESIYPFNPTEVKGSLGSVTEFRLYESILVISSLIVFITISDNLSLILSDNFFSKFIESISSLTSAILLDGLTSTNFPTSSVITEFKFSLTISPISVVRSSETLKVIAEVRTALSTSLLGRVDESNTSTNSFNDVTDSILLVEIGVGSTSLLSTTASGAIGVFLSSTLDNSNNCAIDIIELRDIV